MKEMITENYCDDCDEVVHAVFNTEDFYNYKVGRIRCKCGCVVKPCNECGNRDAEGNEISCANCPLANAKIVDAMNEEDYVRWVKMNESEVFEMMLNGSLGSHYENIAKMI